MSNKSSLLKKMINLISFDKQNNYLKKELDIKQSGSNILISGSLNKKFYSVNKLLFKSRDGEHIIQISQTNGSPSSSFIFSFDISNYPTLLESKECIFDLFLMVNVDCNKVDNEIKAKLEETSDKVVSEDGISYYEYPIRLGNFKDNNYSDFSEIRMDSSTSYFYITKKGYVSYALNTKKSNFAKMKLDNIIVKKHHVDLKGRIFINRGNRFASKIIITGRNTNESFEVELVLSLLRSKNNYDEYSFSASIDLNKILKEGLLKQDIYDLFLKIAFDDGSNDITLRVGNPTFFSRSFKKASYALSDKTVMSVTPYLTIKFNFSLQVDEFNKDVYFYMKKILFWSPFIRLFYKKDDIWIVGEKPYKAQDNGFHFFKHVRQNHPNKNIFYVIEENSPEFENIKSYGNALIYKSKEHVFKTLMASRIIGTHHPDDLYPLRTKVFKDKVKAIKVFLQHGVMGTKNTVHLYGVNSPGFETDLFLVSSDFEKSIIVDDFQYHPGQVKVTGLSRFDSLLAGDVKLKRQILIIPTWREWLLNEDAFEESEYLERYKNLVTDPQLHELSRKYQFEIVFCLHPNMQKYTPYFQKFPIRVISQGEVDVQFLLKESAMMITDYSSVAFDFSFLHKPVVYYQFDRNRFIGKKGSHIDLDNDLPGDIVYERPAILSLVEDYAKNDFKMKDVFIQKSYKFIKYRDLNSSARIYKEIANFHFKKSFITIIRQNRYVKGFFKRFRKSKYYFPTMKCFFRLAKTFMPIDQNLIVFESGIGKQYSDSPRSIYEELLKRNTDLKFVWICNKKIRFSHKGTIRINRLSPRYYYYLARAKFWVNNQNFPTYIKKRKDTIYLQTWHGTPLKKMLFDIENVQGRTDDYVERVYRATKTWDYLISPSPYATAAFKSAFKYKGNVLEIGYPRNDIFYKNEKIGIAKNVKRNLKIPKDKKVILYAPTFRDNQTSKNNKFLFDLKFDLEMMREMLGDEYVLLLRMHVVISNKLKIDPKFSDFVINVSNYSDIQELYLISDILITDYSSVFFDYANSQKPILFFTYDLEEYRDNTRGFYMDLEKESPGPLLRTTEEVIDSIININRVTMEYKERYEKFYHKYCGLEDGQASKRAVDVILKHK